MRRATPTAAPAVAVLAAPTVLAFFKGGYFDGPRDVALIAAGVLLAVTALVAPQPLPRTAPARIALAGLAALTFWTWLSEGWAPLADAAQATFERDVLYLAALTIATAALRPRLVARWAEPALAAGALIVVGNGLLGRLVPDVVHVTPTVSAGGRLDQPLTYWNAMGALAAIGVVLCARLAADPERPRGLRAAAAAATPALAAGLFLSYSRGALAACAAGLVVLVALAPTITQLRAVALVVGTGLLAALACAAFPTVRSLDAGDRALEGAIVLAVILALGAVSAFAIRRLGDRDRPLPPPRHHGWIAAALVAALLVLPGAVPAGERGPHAGNETPRAGAGRLASADSPRYEYWRVALGSFADHPVAGVGAGGFAVEWLRERSQARNARDAHSLPIETLAELGLVGGAALALLAGGVAVAARRVHRFDPVLAAGPAAALTAYAFHASIDWDWEMPALTLVGVALAGLLLASSDEIAASTATAPSTTSAGSAANRNRVEP